MIASSDSPQNGKGYFYKEDGKLRWAYGDRHPFYNTDTCWEWKDGDFLYVGKDANPEFRPSEAEYLALFAKACRPSAEGVK